MAAAVARDAAGKFPGASAVVMEGRIEPDMVESIAYKESLGFV